MEAVDSTLSNSKQSPSEHTEAWAKLSNALDQSGTAAVAVCIRRVITFAIRHVKMSSGHAPLHLLAIDSPEYMVHIDETRQHATDDRERSLSLSCELHCSWADCSDRQAGMRVESSRGLLSH